MICRAQIEASGSSRVSGKFAMAVRGATLDRAKSNPKAELGFLKSRPGWHQFTSWCRLHLFATIGGWTFNFFPEMKANISGMIHCAKSIEVGSASELFGTCLRDEVRSSIRIVEGVLGDGMRRWL